MTEKVTLDPHFRRMANIFAEDDLERLKNCPDDEARESLVVEDKALISRVRRTGSQTASTFFVIGYK